MIAHELGEDKERRASGRRSLVAFVLWRPAAHLALIFAGNGALIGVDLLIATWLQALVAALGLSTTLLPGPVTPSASLSRVLCYLVAAGAMRSGGYFILNFCSESLADEFTARVRSLVVSTMLRRRAAGRPEASAVNLLIGETALRGGTCCMFGVQAASHGMVAAAVVVVMTALAWKEAAAFVLGLGVIAATALWASRAHRSVAALIPVHAATLTAGLERVSRNWLLIRVLRRQGLEESVLSRALASHLAISLRTRAWNHCGPQSSSFFGMALVSGILLVSHAYWRTPALSLISFLYLSVRFTQVLSLALSTSLTARMFLPSLAPCLKLVVSTPPFTVRRAMLPCRRVAFFGGMPAADADRSEPEPTAVAVRAHGALPVAAVGLAHRFGDDATFPTLDFVLPAGARLAVSGPSGSGKSTLIGVLLGVIEPTHGAALIANTEAAAFLRRHRDVVAFVGPEPFLVAGTIRSNLQYGRAKALDSGEIWTALEQVGLAERMRSLPGELEFRLSETGDGLSTGQKQRLCLARALLARPTLMVLDEATANLDKPTEQRVLRALAGLRGLTTVIVVSHQLDLVAGADFHLDLATGVFAAVSGEARRYGLSVPA